MKHTLIYIWYFHVGPNHLSMKPFNRFSGFILSTLLINELHISALTTLNFLPLLANVDFRGSLFLCVKFGRVFR